MLHSPGAADKEEWGNQGLTSAVTNTVKVSAAIKGVANLVANYSADTTVICRIISIDIKEWWLQDSGRKNNLIHTWHVIGVHGLWRH